MNVPKVVCRNCDGEGRHEMPPSYAAVYVLLTGSWQASSDLLTKINADRKGRRPIGQTAFANRLAWLKREGFAESRPAEHSGRMLEWRLL